ncbi:AAA family ATPase [Streptomyces sp. NPDC055037]
MSWASRRDYVAEFGELLADAGPHQGGVMALHGGPGTGKTTLLGRFREHAAESGALYLAATGFRSENDVPFATIEQLTHSSGVPEEARAAVHRLWEDGVPRGASDRGHVERMRDLTSALEAVARETPLVVAVDDAQYADELSRSCLLHLARRAQSSGIIMVMTLDRSMCECHLDRTEEFLLVPGCRVGAITPLPEAEVRRLLESRLGADTAAELLAPVHRVSGGSPALVYALIRDHRAAARKAAPGPGAPVGEGGVVVGETFERTYVARLKHHPQLLSCVRALAVLDRHATPARLGQLLDRGPERLAMEIRELELAGLLEDGAFRHPAARRAVLKALGGDECAGLHLRAAEVLRAEGASVTTVAEHLMAGGAIPDEAGIAVLLRASRQLLAEGDVDASLRCLRLADRAGLEEPQRVEVALGLLGALWCVNPAAAEPEVSRLMSVMRAGALNARAVHALVTWLLWFGRTKEAGEAITYLEKPHDPRDPRARERLAATRTIVAHLSPALLPELPESDPLSDTRDTLSAAYLEHAAHMSRGSSRVPVGDIDPLVLGHTETDYGETLPPPVPGPRYSWDRDAITLIELLQHGDLPQAERLGTALLDRLPGEGSPARVAIFRSVHAYIALQRGVTATAVTRAASALELLPHHGWGVVIGSPLATLVAAHTATGQFDEAARYLEYPVPEEMFHSTVGLFYLVARGHHSLATGRPYAALNDFTACAPLAERWHSPSRHLLGWRTGTAEAYVALDEPARARAMVERELADVGPRPSRFRGNALRVLAAASPPGEREQLLREAVRILRLSDSRLALARALADLGRSHPDNSHDQESRPPWPEAQEPGRRSEAPASPWMTWTPSRPRTAAGLPAATPAPADKPLLSDAERRVAALASEGKSNRQIARHLYITVSTVEQHLTRVYRKLSVRRRAELTQFLGLLTNGMDFPAD